MVECFHAITIDAKHLYFYRCEPYCIVFSLREINRFLETLSSFCIFEKALFLETRDSILETRDSILETRSSNVSRIESRGSSFECQLTFERYCTTNSSLATFTGGQFHLANGYPYCTFYCISLFVCSNNQGDILSDMLELTLQIHANVYLFGLQVIAENCLENNLKKHKRHN